MILKSIDHLQGWLNCTCSTLAALSELAAAESNVSQRQPIRYVELHQRVGICESSFLRHLGILLDSGVVVHSQKDASYRLAKPLNSLVAAFISALA